MFPFSFGKKNLGISKEYSIAEVPLFSNLSPSETKFLEKKIRLVEYKKNDIVYHQGSDPDAFYVICSGRFRVFVRSGYGSERTLTYLYRGDYFGEISILTGKPHSVTVEAINDSLVLKLDKDDFNDLLKNVPSLALHLSRSLGLKLRDESKAQIGEAKIVSIYNLKESVGRTIFAVNLAVSLRGELKKPVLFVDMIPKGEGSSVLLGVKKDFQTLNLNQTDVSKDSEISKFLYDCPSGVKVLHLQDGEKEEFHEKKLTTLLSYLISQSNFVLVDLPREINEAVFKVMTQSDVIYILTEGDTEDLEKCRSLIVEMKKSFTFQEDQIKLILLEVQNQEHRSIQEIEKIIGHKIFSVLPHTLNLEKETNHEKKDATYFLQEVDSLYSRTIRYLARELSGNLVGLVLGSGAAHGLAHIGVIKVLEEANIPVDIVAGSSVGALVGCLWAAGYSFPELEKIALSLNKKSSFLNILGFRDFSIAHQGFFKGRMIIRFLRSLLGQKTFRDLKIPVKVVATNLFTAEEVVFDEGDVVDAIRASISIPGIFRPFRIDDNILIDGGVIDPVPVKVLARLGVKKIIAVNVLSGPSDILQRRELMRQKATELEKELNAAGPIRRWLYKFKGKLKSRYAANIFNVLMNTIQFMEYSIASTATTEADVVIHPVVYDANWIEFYSAEKFIRVGEQKAREQLLEIQKLVEQ